MFRFQHLPVLDQMEALDNVKLLRVRCSESVHKCPIIESDRVDDEGIAFVMTDGFAVPGCLDAGRVLVRQVDVAYIIKA
jgi:hypothetical protein